MNTPCHACGAPMRWIQEAQYWTCDRCGAHAAPGAPPSPNQFQQPPPGPPPGPQHGYPPHGQFTPPPYGYPQPRQGGGKGKWIAIGVVVLALAAGGIVLAVVLSKKSSGGGFDGAESAEALSKQAVEAAAAGDGERVGAMTPSFDLVSSFVECPAEVVAKNKESFAQMRAEAVKNAAAWKDHDLVFKAAKPAESGVTEMKEGQDAGDGCKAVKAMAIHTMTAEVSHKAKENPDNKSLVVTAFKLGDKFYLAGISPPPEFLSGAVPTTPPATDAGPGAVPVSGEMAAAVAEFEKLRNEACACKDKVCAEAMMPRLAAAGDKYGALLTDANMVTLGAAKEAAECLGNAMSAAGTAPPDKPSSGNSIPECDEYAAAAAAFIKCDKVPPESRKAIQDAVDQLKKTWGDGSSLSGEMRKSAADTCIQLRDAMKQGAQAMGCP